MHYTNQMIRLYLTSFIQFTCLPWTSIYYESSAPLSTLFGTKPRWSHEKKLDMVYYMDTGSKMTSQSFQLRTRHFQKSQKERERQKKQLCKVTFSIFPPIYYWCIHSWWQEKAQENHTREQSFTLGDYQKAVMGKFPKCQCTQDIVVVRWMSLGETYLLGGWRLPRALTFHHVASLLNSFRCLSSTVRSERKMRARATVHFFFFNKFKFFLV